MRLSVICVLLGWGITVLAGGIQLEKLWETEPVLTTCESVNYDAKRDVLYVSCINGSPTGKDGNGFIARLKTTGKLLNRAWVTGLNAPKGAAIVGDTLYVSDIDVLVAIHIPKATVTARIPVPGARFLNDVAADSQGNVYVSDSASTTIYRFNGKTVTPWIQNDRIRNPNGLLTRGDELLVGSSRDGRMFAVSFKDRTIREVGKADFGIDGLKPGPKGLFIVSDWQGHVGTVRPGGGYTLLFDTTAAKTNAADLEVILDWDYLFVPTFHHNTVVGYRIRKTTK